MSGSFNPTTLLAIDTETTGLHYWHGDNPFAVSMADQDGNTFYCEWEVDPFTRKVTPERSSWRTVRDLMRDPNLPKWLFNRKFDQRMLSNVGITCKGRMDDGLIAARVCNTNEVSYGLKELSKKYAGIPDDDEQELKKATLKARSHGKKQGWKIATKESHGDGYTAADYWTPKVLDPSSTVCEEYARLDAVRTLVMGVMYSTVAMTAQPAFRESYEREIELFPIIMRMEKRGLSLDWKQNEQELKHWRSIRDEHYAGMLQCLLLGEKTWWGKSRVDFNPGSPVQIRRVLFEAPPIGFGFPITAYVKDRNNRGGFTQNPSISWEDISVYDTEPFVRHYLLWKGADKALSSYFEKYARLALPDPLNPANPCIRGTIKQSGARTLRFSVTDPSLQNIQSKQTAARSYSPIEIRHVFRPRPKMLWVKADYSQQEIRIFADVANSLPMLESIAKGEDINSANANRLWGNLSENGGDNQYAWTAAANSLGLNNPQAGKGEREAWKRIGWSAEDARGNNRRGMLEAARKWMLLHQFDIVEAEGAIIDPTTGKGKKNSRTRAKNCFYAKIYGGGPDAVAAMMYCTREVAQESMSRFDTIFPEIQTFSKSLIGKARQTGYVETVYGDILTVDPGFEYKGVNYLVQGTAARQMKNAIYKVEQYYQTLRKRHGIEVYQILTVHDELDSEIRKDHAHKWVFRGIQSIMKDNGGKLRVPMDVEIEVSSTSWNEGKKVKL